MAEQVTIQAGFTPTMQCLSCIGRAQLTTWSPPRGIDRLLRQFKCINGHVSYRRFKIDIDDIADTIPE